MADRLKDLMEWAKKEENWTQSKIDKLEKEDSSENLFQLQT
jgi:hypothetical protein